MMKKIAVFAALREELSGLKSELKIAERRRQGKILVGSLRGREMILAETGIGMEKAGEMARFVFEEFDINFALSIGFAGGVQPRLKSGDLVMADRILFMEGETGFSEGSPRPVQEIKPPLAKTEDIGRRLSGMGISFRRGGILSVARAVESVQQKKWIGENYSVEAVEMETFAVAREAEKKGISLGALRAISDTVEDTLVDVSALVDKNGEISKIKAGLYVISHPGVLPKFLSLRENSRKAAKTLAGAVFAVI